MSKHIPVLLNESIDGLNIKSSGIYVDLTLGRAGHSSVILSKLSTGKLIGVDQDEEAIEESRIILSKISSNFVLFHSNFKNIKSILSSLNIKGVDGILMDLGVSSPQFDEADRGFSYRNDAPLDMRMNRSQNLTAYDIVNTYSENELFRIFRDYGEEKYAYSIAKNIVKARSDKPIKTTFQLVDIIKASKPMKELKKVGHPAKQVFQALRIETNDELNVLKETLISATEVLNSHGRLAVITFHSLEDKIVKSFFKSIAVKQGNRYDLPDNNEECLYNLITTKAIKPSEIELTNNHRSASAKLRIIERK